MRIPKELLVLQRKAQREEIAKAIKRGKSMEDVCDEFDCCHMTVRRACEEHGVTNLPAVRRRIRKFNKLLEDIKKSLPEENINA